MKKLILIRHSKSTHPFGVSDFDRPLSDGGKADARRIAAAGVSHFTDLPLIWCSPAKRTIDTAQLFAAHLSDAFKRLEIVEDLYTFSMDKLKQVIRSAPDTENTLVVFGHNEAITEFVNTFGNVYIDNVPTTGFVPITFSTDSWSELKSGETGRCLFPKLLHS